MTGDLALLFPGFVLIGLVMAWLLYLLMIP
jgi:hypothetical protein